VYTRTIWCNGRGLGIQLDEYCRWGATKWFFCRGIRVSVNGIEHTSSNFNDRPTNHVITETYQRTPSNSGRPLIVIVPQRQAVDRRSPSGDREPYERIECLDSRVQAARVHSKVSAKKHQCDFRKSLNVNVLRDSDTETKWNRFQRSTDVSLPSVVTRLRCFSASHFIIIIIDGHFRSTKLRKTPQKTKQNTKIYRRSWTIWYDRFDSIRSALETEIVSRHQSRDLSTSPVTPTIAEVTIPFSIMSFAFSNPFEPQTHSPSIVELGPALFIYSSTFFRNTVFPSSALRSARVRDLPVQLRAYETRLACIVLLRPNIENAEYCQQSIVYISVALMADPVNTAVLDPCRFSGLRPASTIASIDLSKQTLVSGSVLSASLGRALKNVASNLSTVFSLPAPPIAPSSSVTRARRQRNRIQNR